MTNRGTRAGLRIVLTTVSSDAHTWNLVFLQLWLEDLGHEVVNLGPCVPYDLLCATVRRKEPDLVVVSSVNGHGHDEGVRLVRRLREVVGALNVPVVIGGKLGLLGTDTAASERSLTAAGFDAVFCGGGDLQRFDEYLARLSVLRHEAVLRHEGVGLGAGGERR